MADDGQDLKRKAIQSTAWYASNRFVTQVISWGVTLILARLLAPSDYGLFAMAVAVINFLELFQEFGLGVAIVQRKTLTPRELSTVFWTALLASTVIVGIAWLGAPVAADFYHEPKLVSIVRALSLVFLVNSLGTVPYNLLTKEIDFRHRSVAEAVASLTAAGLSLLIAWHGYGVWALVAGNLGRAVVLNIGVFAFARWLPRFEYAWHEVREMLHFGIRVAGSTAAQTLSGVVNTAIIGRLLGRRDLGYYSMSDTLGRYNPLHRLSTSVVTQLSLPIFSKLQDRDAELRRYFLRITKYLAAISLPLQVGIALVAADLVTLALSEKWLPTVPVVQLFSIGGIMQILPLASFPLLTARGRVTFVLRYQILYAIYMAILSYVGCQFGLYGVAVSWAIGFSIIRFIPLARSLSEVRITPVEYIRSIGAPVISVLFMSAAVLAVLHLPFLPSGAAARLLICIAVGAVCYIGLLLRLDRGIVGEARDILRELKTRSPRKEQPDA